MQTVWGALVYEEAFRRLGYTFDYKTYPPARASVLVNNGTFDGEPGRIDGYNEKYSNLVKVDVPILVMEISAYAIDPDIEVKTWEDLGKDEAIVNYYRGMAYAEKFLPNYVDASHLLSVARPEQDIRKLIAGRVHIYVDTKLRADKLIARPEFRDAGIRELAVLESLVNYPYLHKKHAALAPQLAEVLKNMIESGDIDKFYSEALKRYRALQ